MAQSNQIAFKVESPSAAKSLLVTFLSACIIGVLVALVTICFIGLVSKAESWRVLTIASYDRLTLSLFLYQSSLLASGMFILILIRRIFQVKRWHGPADVIHAAHTDISILSPKIGIATISSVFVSVVAGASVGTYGPLVHLGGFLSGVFNSFFRSRILSQDMIIGCGVAAAISAGFNAPIAGMIFAHEVVLRHFSMRALAPIAISSIASFSVSSWLFEDIRWLRLDTSIPSIMSLSPGLIISGLFFGVIAVSIIRFQIRISRWAGSSGLPDWKLGGIAVIVCSIIGFFVPEALGLGTSTIKNMLDMNFGFVLLLLFLFSKVILTAASTCLGFSLGIFSPSLFIGAAAGGISGYFINIFGLPVSLPIFMVCGMAALSGAITGAPIAVMIIIIELTMSYDLAVATMIAVGTCSLVTFSFGCPSLFDQQLLLRDIKINSGRVSILLAQMKIDSLATSDFIEIDINSSASVAAKKMANGGCSEGYCIAENGVLIGKVLLQDLVINSTLKSLATIVDKNPIHLSSGCSVEKAREIASTFIGEALPVLEPETFKLLGIVSEADIFTAVLQTQNSVNSIEKS